MTEKDLAQFSGKLDKKNLANLAALKNEKLNEYVAEAIKLCNPAKVFVCTDSAEDIAYVRKMSLELGEESPLATKGHTVHFDGYFDQGRDKAVTKYLLPPNVKLHEAYGTMDREKGLAEVLGILKDTMKGRTMVIRFFSLGPVNSPFSISGVQITDSFYVCHSEDLLYRAGYEQFKSLKGSPDFFYVLHSAGELAENKTSKNYDKKRIYIDLTKQAVYSVNTQYAGNTVGFKKLALRLAISKADREGWLSEHMFVMGVHGPKDRVTYLTGAFPSFCGKTSTAMLPGETIIGDDLAYIREIKGEARTVNVENGLFGIIRNVNPKDDPLIYKLLTDEGEVIFSNVLIKDGKPYWEGMGSELPTEGVNHSGQWKKGNKDAQGNNIDPSHKNSRYTVRLAPLANLDKHANDPAGVPVSGVIYGGRDSDTSVPVQQAFDWAHGVMIGASLESETTAAVIGKEGVRAFQPMANMDFLSIPLGKYVKNHFDFAKKLKKTPLVFGVNYFIRDKKGEYLSSILDKRVWAKWMDLRVHGEAGAICTPTGLIPIYEDLVPIFKKVLGQDYPRELYEKQFTIRVPENLSKLERIAKIYREQAPDAPKQLFDIMEEQAARLKKTQADHGDYISPFKFAKASGKSCGCCCSEC